MSNKFKVLFRTFDRFVRKFYYKVNPVLVVAAFLLVMGGGMVWDSWQRNHQEAKISTLQEENDQLKKQIHLLIRKGASEEVERLRDTMPQ
ncbi:MAG: hypothetical protein AAFR61_29600 [Bacteroidota bacterium]